jgi:Family of unknown function (DUF5681)
MPSYEVGYKKPPRHSQFKPGNRCNPKGRGKRKVETEAEILKRVLNFPAEFRHGGKSKRAPRIELMIRSLAQKRSKATSALRQCCLRSARIAKNMAISIRPSSR